MSGAVTVTLHLNAGDETRIMSYREGDACLPLCDIKCGGMTGRTVAEGERIAAEIVERYNAHETRHAAEAASKQQIAELVEALAACEALLADAGFLGGKTHGIVVAALARAKATEQGEG